MTCLFASMVYPNTFMLDGAEKQSDPKTCWEEDLEKQGSSTS